MAAIAAAYMVGKRVVQTKARPHALDQRHKAARYHGQLAPKPTQAAAQVEGAR